ncbi:L-aspartate oxidase [Rossellomorea marisflavi]|uniref:L-aspartate oxidase n=1 Tax=Rossellomorea marisflavi TaxID=189381 RepID=UPI0025CA9FE4|nr:L-aspartate oxidase [Rossellomorea marisflavi]GLI83036.1 L-aspartate oxidase [Rossellomorea marisflavi]
MRKADVLIIGSGVAALQLAKNIQDRMNVMIITKSRVKSSNSYLAQGGIAAALSPGDSPGLHMKDTLIAGEDLQEEGRVMSFVEDGKRAVEALLSDGMPFDPELGMEGAHSTKRIVHSGGDQTGRFLIDFLISSLSKNVKIIEGEMAYHLLKDRNGRVGGVRTKDEAGVIHTYTGDHIVLASGGVGGIYASTSNHPSVTGTGIAMACLAGAVVSDMEFIQFHPTLMLSGGRTKGLISEAVRGEGGVLVREDGSALMESIHPLKDLAPRHVVAEAIYRERLGGGNVYLDITGIRNFSARFPSITVRCEKEGVPIEGGRIPVAPGCHFIMGGIVVDDVGRTNLDGLYAIGEAACTGVHGANRLASNSLLEGIVYGQRLADHLKEALPPKTAPLAHASITGTPGQSPDRTILKKRMMEEAGIIRSEEGLQRLMQWLDGFGLTYESKMDDLDVEEMEDYLIWVVSRLIGTASLLREESRGGHIRRDHPKKRPDWDKKSIHMKIQTGRLKVSVYESVETKIHA